MSWPQFSPNANNQLPRQRSSDIEKQSLRHGIKPEEARVFERATQIVMKNKSFRPRQQGKKGLKNLESMKTLAGRTQVQAHKARKQPLTVTAQFQQSLHSLMDTLNQANPFFIRCIKSNAEKIPNTFDDDTVQRQLRYTGMLETVRIRQAGYNVRLSFDEFIQLYRILLPRGLLSSQSDVKDFLLTLNLNRDNYQVGSSKIFMRECEKLKLDYRLHQQIMAGIVTVQRWFRAVLERRRFLRLREAVVTLQAYWRGVHARRQLAQSRQWQAAALHIQSVWRTYSTLRWYQKLRSSVVMFQAHARGYLARVRLKETRPAKQSPMVQLSVQSDHLLTHKPLVRNVNSQDDLSSGKQETFDLGYQGTYTRKHETREISRLGNPNKDNVGVERRKKLSSRRINNNMGDSRLQLEESCIDKGVVERKTSSDSLTSQRSSDSQSSAVRNTINRAKGQTQHITVVNKKDGEGEGEMSECQAGAGSGGGEDVVVWTKCEATPAPTLTRQEPLAPARITRRRELATRSHPDSHAPVPTQLDLKRRNSDPASQAPPPSLAVPPVYSPSSDLEWKGTSMFTIAGHNFRKVGRFNKEDRCSFCDKPMDAFVTQGHKCTDCKALFHTKCIQNGGVLTLPCGPGPGGGRKKQRKAHLHHHATEHHTHQFSLTGTSEFTDRTDKIISDVRELQLMQDFISKKIYKIEETGAKESQVDRVFKQALREFKDNLVATYSVVNKQGPEALNIKYKDLIANFLRVMETVCLQEQTKTDFPVTMGVNAFRGFLNEFMALTRVEQVKQPKTKRKKEKKRKVEDPISHVGHHFVLTIINIPTACEICTSFFMWPLERGLVCQNCKLTCHKKCYLKVSFECTKDGMRGSAAVSPHRVFGVPLHQLATGDGKVPLVVDRLIHTIEMYGLYMEGIYRKSGVSSKVRELKARMEEGNLESVQFDQYQVHVLASVLKSFLRDMPEPLLTFDCYEEFLRAANLTEDRVSTLFAILKKLPKPNFDLMERLIFHLARVASHEDVNRMTSSALAIVFAPCILRTNKAVPAQDSLNDIARQTACVETIISEQLRKLRTTLADIDTLDEAKETATVRLDHLRCSKIFTPDELLLPVKPDDEEEILMDHIEEIQKEKALLTSALPSLTRTTSDDDLLSTDDGSLDDVDTQPQPLSRHRPVGQKRCKRAEQPLYPTSHTPDYDEDPIMV